MPNNIKLDGVEANIDDVLAELRKHGDVTFARPSRIDVPGWPYTYVEMRSDKEYSLRLCHSGSLPVTGWRSTMYMSAVAKTIGLACEIVDARRG